MKLYNKMTMRDRSDAAKYMMSTKGWKMIKELLEEKKIKLAKKILLKRQIKDGTSYVLSESDLDFLRKEILDINWFLNIANGYVTDDIPEAPDKDLKQDDLDGILQSDILS